MLKNPKGSPFQFFRYCDVFPKKFFSKGPLQFFDVLQQWMFKNPKFFFNPHELTKIVLQKFYEILWYQIETKNPPEIHYTLQLNSFHPNCNVTENFFDIQHVRKY